MRLEHVKPALNIVHIYDRIESRISPEKVLEGWVQILKELSVMEDSQEAILMIGDWNRAVGDDELGVEGNKSQVSYEGGLIMDLVSTGKYFLLNNLGLARGEPGTRICPETGSQSCLDLAIGSSNLLPYIKMVLIDSGRLYAPRSAIKMGGGVGVVFTDHYPILLELEMPSAEHSIKKPKSSWNTMKPGGWDKYKELSDKMAEKINRIVADEGLEDEIVMRKVDKIQEKIKFIAFGKSKPQTENAKTIQKEAKELLTRQSKRMTEALEKGGILKKGWPQYLR